MPRGGAVGQRRLSFDHLATVGAGASRDHFKLAEPNSIVASPLRAAAVSLLKNYKPESFSLRHARQRRAPRFNPGQLQRSVHFGFLQRLNQCNATRGIRQSASQATARSETGLATCERPTAWRHRLAITKQTTTTSVEVRWRSSPQAGGVGERYSYDLAEPEIKLIIALRIHMVPEFTQWFSS